MTIRLFLTLMIWFLCSLTATATEVKPLLEHVFKDTLGNVLHYPDGQPAEISSYEITMGPGDVTKWHQHPVPTIGFILSGEVTVYYADDQMRTFKAGDAVIEAQFTPHQGQNSGTSPVKILVVYAGAKGTKNTILTPQFDLQH